MELVEGRSLAEFVTPGGLPLAQLLDLAMPLADALVAAHERGRASRPQAELDPLHCGIHRAALTTKTQADAVTPLAL